jgi:hypothetical protein
MYMIFLVLDDPDRLDELIESWDNAGIHGATIIESTGIQRMQQRQFPMRYAFGISHGEERGHYTLMAIVADQQAVARCLQVTEALLGDLDAPNRGVFAAWPLSTVKGVSQTAQE